MIMLNNIFAKFDVGQTLTDMSMGSKWLVLENIPDGVLLKNKSGGKDGCLIYATPESCFMAFNVDTFFYVLTTGKQEKLCILGTRQPNLEEATAFIRTAYAGKYDSVEVTSVQPIDAEAANEQFDLSGYRSWPIFCLHPELYPAAGRRIWSRDFSALGEIKAKSKRYCAACQRVHGCYVVEWPDGKTTKPCTKGVELLASGKMHIT